MKYTIVLVDDEDEVRGRIASIFFFDLFVDKINHMIQYKITKDFDDFNRTCMDTNFST